MMLAFVMVFMFCSTGLAASRSVTLTTVNTGYAVSGKLKSMVHFSATCYNNSSSERPMTVRVSYGHYDDSSGMSTTYPRYANPGKIAITPNYAVTHHSGFKLYVKINSSNFTGGVSGTGYVYDFEL